MSTEIYSKLYLALLRSLQKKGTKEAVRQYYANHEYMNGASSNGIIGGSDSFTIIGESGIGKSSAITRAVELLCDGKLLYGNTVSRIIPCLTVQCPFDCSVKGMMLEILRNVDEKLGSTYYQTAIKSRTNTVDMLIGMVSTVAINHIGLLIVDEIQNVVGSKNGRNLVGMLTQLTVPKNHVDRAHTVGAGHVKQEPPRRKVGEGIRLKLNICGYSLSDPCKEVFGPDVN